MSNLSYNNSSSRHSRRTDQFPRIQGLWQAIRRQELQKISIADLIKELKSEYYRDYRFKESKYKDLKVIDDDTLKELYQTCSNHLDEIQSINNPTPQNRLDCQPYQAIMYATESEGKRRSRHYSDDSVRNWLMENRRRNIPEQGLNLLATVAQQATLNPHAQPFIPASQQGLNLLATVAQQATLNPHAQPFIPASQQGLNLLATVAQQVTLNPHAQPFIPASQQGRN